MGIQYGNDLVRCPSGAKFLNYPTLVIMSIITAILSGVLVYIIFKKYRFFILLSKRVEVQTITTTGWTLFFVCIFIREVFEAIRSGISNNEERKIDAVIFFFSLAFVTARITILSFSLYYNYVQSNDSLRLDEDDENYYDKVSEITPINQQNNNQYQKSGTKFLIILMILLVIFFVLLYVKIYYPSSTPILVLLIIAFAFQEAPAVLLSILIIIKKRNAVNISSKIFLGIAVVFQVLHDITSTVLIDVMPDGCPFYIGSWVNFFSLLYIGSLVLYFLFIRMEFFRNQRVIIFSKINSEDLD
ncbi:abc transporter permease ytrc-related [Anaeramoeba ignava]|uniref:Abc transporter permease ytrc-related n=1 Tax=Anaeramoeba ignava TaxID=1746090 RepID=A0A9Q0R9D5_ANAIG|nr:abc transporter permease ytrc-related [Anaeramoeba ignava]